MQEDAERLRSVASTVAISLFFNPGGWSGWQSLGKPFSDRDIDALHGLLYNPVKHFDEVYVRSAGQVAERYWSGTNNWSDWQLLGGNLS
jgi:hypothetical protein